MPRRELIKMFHEEHAEVVQALVDLRIAIQSRNPAQVRATLDLTNELIGPHFKFEELYLYPQLKEFLGEPGIMRLLNEHDAILRGIWSLRKLATMDTWTSPDAESAAAALELMWGHPIRCDGLCLYIERLPDHVQSELLEQLQELRRQGTTLLEYQNERLGERPAAGVRFA